MGTRGACGFRKNNIDKITYNHSNSDPEHLGDAVVQFCRFTPIENLHRIFDLIQLVDPLDLPTEKQVSECRVWMHTGPWVPGQSNWHDLLHKAQDGLIAYRKLRYMVDYAGFLQHSLHCEYAYIVNLDTCELEFWEGFQLQPTQGNRYGMQPDDSGYYPCRLVMVFPLRDIPHNAAKLMSDGRSKYEPYTDSVF